MVGQQFSKGGPTQQKIIHWTPTQLLSRECFEIFQNSYLAFTRSNTKKKYSIIISNYQGANPGVFGGQSQVYKTGQKVLGISTTAKQQIHSRYITVYTKDIQLIYRSMANLSLIYIQQQESRSRKPNCCNTNVIYILTTLIAIKLGSKAKEGCTLNRINPTLQLHTLLLKIKIKEIIRKLLRLSSAFNNYKKQNI